MSLGPVLDAALQVQSVCERHGLAFCVIGGVALQRWGEPRFTADVDLSLFTQAGEEEKLAATLIEEIEPRFEDALDFARRTRVLLLQSTQGVGIDVVLAGLPFEARVIGRASSVGTGRRQHADNLRGRGSGRDESVRGPRSGLGGCYQCA